MSQSRELSVSDDPADLLIVNGRLFASGPPTAAHGSARSGSSALAIRGNLIARLVNEREVAQLRGPATEVLDAAGGLIMPGFNDAHMHLRHGALALERLDLFGLVDLGAVERAIRSYAEQHPDDEWIVGGGWLYAAFPGGMPTRHLLDAIVPNRPVYLACFDGHSGWANSRALELAGIEGATADPADGQIVRNEAGQPTGALKERACELVERHVPQPDDEELLALMTRALHSLAAGGITSAQDAWASPADFALIGRMRDRRQPPVRLRVALELLPRLGEAALVQQLDEFEAAVGHRERDPFLRGGIVKSFLDGVVEARTAYMLEPYPGTDGTGDRRWDDAELRRTIAELDRRGWQVQLHAIGTAAVRQALDAYESLRPGRAAKRRHRVEHIETIAGTDLPRFARLGVVASMQPFHAIPESEQADTWRSVLAPRLAESGWCIASLLDSGAVVAFGSDWPVVPFDPFLELHAAVTRRSTDNRPPEGWLPAERVSLEQALRAFTWGGAYAEHAERRRGVLAPGYLADVIVLDRDLLNEGESAILGTKVRATIVDGRLVHGGA